MGQERGGCSVLSCRVGCVAEGIRVSSPVFPFSMPSFSRLTARESHASFESGPESLTLG